MSSIVCLPEELLLAVFGHVPLVDYKNLFETCRRFYRTIQIYQPYRLLRLGTHPRLNRYDTFDRIALPGTRTVWYHPTRPVHRNEAVLVVSEFDDEDRHGYRETYRGVTGMLSERFERKSQEASSKNDCSYQEERSRGLYDLVIKGVSESGRFRTEVLTRYKRYTSFVWEGSRLVRVNHNLTPWRTANLSFYRSPGIACLLVSTEEEDCEVVARFSLSAYAEGDQFATTEVFGFGNLDETIDCFIEECKLPARFFGADSRAVHRLDMARGDGENEGVRCVLRYHMKLYQNGRLAMEVRLTNGYEKTKDDARYPLPSLTNRSFEWSWNGPEAQRPFVGCETEPVPKHFLTRYPASAVEAGWPDELHVGYEGEDGGWTDYVFDAYC